MILLVQSYPGANEAFERHYSYYLKSGADRIVGIGTTDGGCKFPEGCESTIIGKNSYINGSVLPQRLIDTLKYGVTQNDPVICVCEYDTLFFRHLPIERMEHAVAAHYTGGQTWGSKARSFYHGPWVFHREAARRFVECGQDEIDKGICGPLNQPHPHPPECSTDVFFGYVTERHNFTVQDGLWKEFTRNSFDLPGSLEAAREAYRAGVDVIHGCKTKAELDFILS